MIILIGKKNAIKTDKLNYMFCDKSPITPKCKDGWKGRWYYSTLRECYVDLLEELTKDGDKETIKENLEETVKLLAELKKEAKGYTN